MHTNDPDNLALEQLRIYEDDKLILDGADASTYIVIDDADHLAAALASLAAANADPTA